jgi:hypothetical protein
MTNPTNRQMAAAFKKIGFHKCNLQMTRMGYSYTYKDTGAMFTFPKAHKEQFQISAPGYDGWSCIILSEEKWQSLQENPYIDWHWDKTKPFDGRLSAMEVLLCIARGFAVFVDATTIAASQAS